MASRSVFGIVGSKYEKNVQNLTERAFRGYHDRMIGIIPAIQKPHGAYSTPEMFPVGSYSDGNTIRVKPIAQHIAENMVGAGVDRLAVVMGDRKEDLMRHFQDGDFFGVPVTYHWAAGYGLASGIAQVGHVMENQTVLAALPGLIVPPGFLTSMVRELESVDLVVATQCRHRHGAGIKDIQGKTIGAYCWSPEFTAFLHSVTVMHKGMSMEAVILEAIRQRVRVVATCPDQYLVLYNDWSGFYGPVQPKMVPDPKRIVRTITEPLSVV